MYKINTYIYIIYNPTYIYIYNPVRFSHSRLFAVIILIANKMSEPLKSEPLKSEPLKFEPLKSEPLKSEPFKSEPLNSEPLKSEPLNG